MSSTLAANLAAVQARVAGACERVGRDRAEVEILAVSKTHPVPVLLEALAIGLHDLGESRVQEALEKIPELPAEARIHLIGRLQSNKVNKAVGAFASIQSVDGLDLLTRIARRATQLEQIQPIWIQVNSTGETQKAGCAPESVTELWEAALQMGGVRPLGLMTIGQLGDDESIARARFARLRGWAEELRGADGTAARLSMGMSDDFEWAVLEGSHQIRVGSVLFGARRPR